MESVNNNNNNVGLYTTISSVFGGGIGAGIAYASKPFLKNNVPNDTFEKEIKSNVEKVFDEKIEQLKKIKSNDEAVKIIGENTLGKYVEEARNAIQKGEIAEAIIQGESVLSTEKKNINVKDLYKSFTEDANKLSTEFNSAIKKAIKSMNTKYMLIFGGIGAGIAGLITFLFSKNR